MPCDSTSQLWLICPLVGWFVCLIVRFFYLTYFSQCRTSKKNFIYLYHLCPTRMPIWLPCIWPCFSQTFFFFDAFLFLLLNLVVPFFFFLVSSCSPSIPLNSASLLHFCRSFYDNLLSCGKKCKRSSS